MEQAGRRLLNENVQHNNDDVSVWELTGLLLVCRGTRGKITRRTT